MRYDAPLKETKIAGILHDCAKCMPDDKLMEYCTKNKIPVSSVEERNPYLLHGKVGARIAKKKYHIENDDIINAIQYHTTGRTGMSLMEKIIFVADYMEPGRKQAKNLDQIRKMAFEDIEKTVLKILKDTLEYLEYCGGETDPITRDTYLFYVKKQSNHSLLEESVC